VRTEHRDKLRELLGISQEEPTAPVDRQVPAMRKEHFQQKHVA